MTQSDDKKKFIISYKPNAYFESSIGKLAIFSIAHGHERQLISSLSKDLSTCDPGEFIEKMIPYICYPVEALGEEETKPEGVVLSSDDVGRLENSERDEISRLYVEKEDYLFRKEITEHRTDKNGLKIIHIKFGEIEHEKKEGESNIQYLHRLYVIQEKKWRASIARLGHSFFETANFSKNAFSSLNSTLSIASEMAKTVNALRLPQIHGSLANTVENVNPLLMGQSFSRAIDSISKSVPNYAMSNSDFRARLIPQNTIVPESPRVEVEELGKLAVEAKWAPFRFLGERLDKLVELIIGMIETHTKIAVDIKSAGEADSRLTKMNLKLTIFIVFLTILGLFVAGFGLYQNSKQSSQGSVVVKENAAGIINELKNLSNSISASNKATEDAIKTVVDEMRRANNDEIKRLNTEVESLRQQLSDSRQIIEKQNDRISKLEKASPKRQ